MSNANAKAENLAAMRTIRTEMARHAVDSSEVRITISHGVVQLLGKVRPRRGGEESFTSDVHTMLKGIRRCHGIRDVITNWMGPTLNDK